MSMVWIVYNMLLYVILIRFLYEKMLISHGIKQTIEGK